MPFNVPLTGQIEPRARSWKGAGVADRRAFYLRAGQVAVRVLRAQLSKAVGATGKRMQPRKRPRRDGADGPVMTPHRLDSRTIRLMSFHAWDRGVTVFWHGGGGQKHRKPWATVLSYHALGRVKGAPARDVRMSDASVAQVRDQMELWWDQYRRRQANLEKLKQPPPPVRSPRQKPRTPAPKPVPQPQPPRPRLVVERHAEAKPAPLPSPLVPPPPLTLADLQALAAGAKLPRRNLAAAGPAEVKPAVPKPSRLQRLGAFLRGAFRKITGR